MRLTSWYAHSPYNDCPQTCAGWLTGESAQEPDHVCIPAAHYSTQDFALTCASFALTFPPAYPGTAEAAGLAPPSLTHEPGLSPAGVEAFQALRHWATAWPLPVSRPAFEEWFSEHASRVYGPDRTRWPAPPLPRLPLATDEPVWAGLAARRVTKAGVVWLLGTVTRIDGTPEPRRTVRVNAAVVEIGAYVAHYQRDELWRWGEPVLLTEAHARTSADLDALTREAKRLRKWYMPKLYGKPVTGRREGSTALSADDFKRRYRQAYENWCTTRDDRPTIPDIAAELGLSTSTMYGYLERWELPWPPV